ncbi:MAG TPA: hypothetical protein VGB66_08435 [Longimicrobium sp.]
MPLTTDAAGTGPSLAANLLPGAAAGQISNAIGRITAGDIFGPVGGIPGLQNLNGWRVDRQNAPPNTVNLSVQRNDVGAPSTVASVFVDARYNIAPPPPNAGPGPLDAYRARMRELERTVRRGLEQSFASYAAPVPAPTPNAPIIQRFQVAGVFSAG